ncbi:MAG: glycosyltransferase family 9 protein [Phycisphaerales bacterium]
MMRILISNPDTIGDVVLRQPLFAALQAAGHELTLIVRPLLGPLVSLVAPGARVTLCDANLYDPTLRVDAIELDDAAGAAAEADPDLLVVAPFQWTPLEERLARDLPRARSIGMAGRRFVALDHGPTGEASWSPTTAVSVAEDVPEVRKNELLAGAILERAVTLPDPRLEATPAYLAAGRVALARLGLDEDEFWIACVGDGPFTAVRNWRHEAWAEALAQWSSRHDRRFLFIGSAEESESCEHIRGLMGEAGARCATWTGAAGGDLDTLLGLVALSRGYVGRDTGPMHLAAALGKPVLAVFGGGTWPRFLPTATPSISITVGVPCVGCGWNCHLPESYCIKQVPVPAVVQAADELESGRVQSREARQLRPDAALLARIGRESTHAARERLLSLSVSRRESMDTTATLTASLERALKEAGRAEAVAHELESARAEANRRESVLRQRVAATEALLRSRERELLEQIAALEAKAADGTHREQAQAALARAVAAEHRASQLAADFERRAADIEARLARAHEALTPAQAQLTDARNQAADLKTRLANAEREIAVLASLSRQREDEAELLRIRIHDLMASRWRKYGQRLGIVMTMPWEREARNGHH